MECNKQLEKKVSNEDLSKRNYCYFQNIKIEVTQKAIVFPVVDFKKGQTYVTSVMVLSNKLFMCQSSYLYQLGHGPRVSTSV